MERSEAPDTPDHGARAINADVAVGEAEAFYPSEEFVLPTPRVGQGGRIARSTAFFSIATAASRVAGLAREVVAAGYYGVNGPMSAFTVAFQLPNLVRALFADSALQPAFVPVFTDLVGRRQFKEAFRLASTLMLLMTMVLGVLTAVFVVAAPVIVPLFAPRLPQLAPRPHRLALADPLPDPDHARGQRHRRRHPQQLRPLRRLRDLALLLERGDHRRRRRPASHSSRPRQDLRLRDRHRVRHRGAAGDPGLGPAHTPFHFTWSFDWRNPGVRRVLLLMLPVTISLGLINFNQVINSFFGSLVSDQAPAAIEKAFRLYQLPQGIFSVAIATVLFPTLARFANNNEFVNLRATLANGMRQILFVLLPATAAILVLSEPIIRLVYQRGEFHPHETQIVATALFWFAFSLPTNGVYLLQTRTFFSLQRPWQATALAVIDLVVSAVAACGALQAVRGGRDRRRDGDRDERRGLLPGLHPAPQVPRPGAGTAALDGDPHLDRLGGAGRRSAG